MSLGKYVRIQLRVVAEAVIPDLMTAFLDLNEWNKVFHLGIT
jgi:hypothetical protein